MFTIFSAGNSQDTDDLAMSDINTNSISNRIRGKKWIPLAYQHSISLKIEDIFLSDAS